MDVALSAGSDTALTDPGNAEAVLVSKNGLKTCCSSLERKLKPAAQCAATRGSAALQSTQDARNNIPSTIARLLYERPEGPAEAPWGSGWDEPGLLG